MDVLEESVMSLWIVNVALCVLIRDKRLRHNHHHYNRTGTATMLSTWLILFLSMTTAPELYPVVMLALGIHGSLSIPYLVQRPMYVDRYYCQSIAGLDSARRVVMGITTMVSVIFCIGKLAYLA